MHGAVELWSCGYAGTYSVCFGKMFQFSVYMLGIDVDVLYPRVVYVHIYSDLMIYVVSILVYMHISGYMSSCSDSAKPSDPNSADTGTEMYYKTSPARRRITSGDAAVAKGEYAVTTGVAGMHDLPRCRGQLIWTCISIRAA